MQVRLTRASNPVSVILFDMDNTLFDLFSAKQEACRAVTCAMGKGDFEEFFRYFLSGKWGFEDFRNIRDYLNDYGCYTTDFYDQCCHLYDSVKLAGISPYPYVPETLAALKNDGYRLGIITDAFTCDAERRLEKTDLRDFFDNVVTCDVTGRKKPAPDPFLHALHILQVLPEEAVLVGDSPHRDMEPGKRLGIRTVYARYGDRFSQGRTSLYADFIIDSMRELIPVIASLSGLKERCESGEKHLSPGC